MNLVLVCVVCYNTDPVTVRKCLASIAKQDIDWKGVFVDHSLNSDYKNLVSEMENWTYYERGDHNDGFGKGNNYAVKHGPNSEFILLVNPDLFLQENALLEMLYSFQIGNDIGLVTGQIKYPDGSIQKLNKRNPLVFALLGRRFPFLKKIKIIEQSILKYEMSDMNYFKSAELEFASGCLMLISRKVWKIVRGFDERYLLYFEDADITRKVRIAGYKAIYNPLPKAIHLYQRGSHKSIKLFLIFIGSMIKYFRKWGWEWK